MYRCYINKFFYLSLLRVGRRDASRGGECSRTSAYTGQFRDGCVCLGSAGDGRCGDGTGDGDVLHRETAVNTRLQLLLCPVLQPRTAENRENASGASAVFITLSLFRRLTSLYCLNGRLGSWVVSVLDSGAVGPGFKSQLRRCRVTVSGKLFKPIVHLFTKQQNW